MKNLLTTLFLFLAIISYGQVKYGPAKMYYVRATSIKENVPPLTDFTSASIICVDTATGKVYQKISGKVTLTGNYSKPKVVVPPVAPPVTVTPLEGIYVSPSGNDANAGTLNEPFATLNKAWSIATAGTTIWIRGGTYSITSQQYLANKSGTASSPIKILAYPGEIPKITRSSSFTGDKGIFLYKISYVQFKGIEIFGFKQLSGASLYYGIFGYDVNNCTFEQLNVHHNGFGLSIGNADGTSINNYILNCDFHHNSDPITSISGMAAWGGADGLAIRAMGNGVNTIEGCRMWMNSDDGFDPYYNQGSFIIKNCWSFWNGYRPGANVGDIDLKITGGDGNGFKLGPLYNNTNSSTVVMRTITNCLAFENTANGFDQNTYLCISVLYNNTAYKNGAAGFNFGYYISSPLEYIAMNLKNNIAYLNGYPKSSTAGWVTSNNTWENKVTVTDADFITVSSTGMDGPRQVDGSLPFLTFLRLAAGSDLINSGVNVGIPYYESAPDMGAFEYKK